jgi:hypothetical protein
VGWGGGGLHRRLNGYSLQFALHDYSKLYHKQFGNAMKRTISMGLFIKALPYCK